MADQEQTPPKPETREEASEQGGVFGNLPGSRPGVRSPRRGEAGPTPATGATPKAGGRQSQAAARKPAEPRSPHAPAGRAAEPKSPRPPADRPPERSVGTEPESAPPAEDEHGGVEELAWAGIAVAAEAATLGVRLLSRAVDAVRKPPAGR